MITKLGGEHCYNFTSNKIIKLSGSRTSTLYLLNPSEIKVEKIEIDGCVITDGLRCDWLVHFEVKKVANAIFVELKGADIKKAVKQLEATIEKLCPDPKSGIKVCLVAYTRNPLSGTDIQEYKVYFKKHYNAKFKTVRDGGESTLLE